MRVFISHKQEDAKIAKMVFDKFKALEVDCYLDLLDNSISGSGKELTNHIKSNLNNCTDIVVVMSERTRFSQWVPFEVGMSAQINMPTATFLNEYVTLPDFLEYWPRLKYLSDINEYVKARKEVFEQSNYKGIYESASMHSRNQVDEFYSLLKGRLKKY